MGAEPTIPFSFATSHWKKAMTTIIAITQGKSVSAKITAGCGLGRGANEVRRRSAYFGVSSGF